MSSDLGHSGSHFELALCYKNGIGVKKDLVLAVKLLKIVKNENIYDYDIPFIKELGKILYESDLFNTFLQMQEKIKQLEKKIEDLEYAPPSAGGPKYLEALNHFESMQDVKSTK
jgi:TPR repeat protein